MMTLVKERQLGSTNASYFQIVTQITETIGHKLTFSELISD